MRYIILSADNAPTLYEAPDAVAEQLPELAQLFLDVINAPGSPFLHEVRDASGQSYLVLCYNEQDFVAWLNRQAVTAAHPVKKPGIMHMEDREIIMSTAQKQRYLPYDQQQYPWYNF